MIRPAVNAANLRLFHRQPKRRPQQLQRSHAGDHLHFQFRIPVPERPAKAVQQRVAGNHNADALPFQHCRKGFQQFGNMPHRHGLSGVEQFQKPRRSNDQFHFFQCFFCCRQQILRRAAAASGKNQFVPHVNHAFLMESVWLLSARILSFSSSSSSPTCIFPWVRRMQFSQTFSAMVCQTCSARG